jgi:hypothetical protein
MLIPNTEPDVVEFVDVNRLRFRDSELKPFSGSGDLRSTGEVSYLRSEVNGMVRFVLNFQYKSSCRHRSLGRIYSKPKPSSGWRGSSGRRGIGFCYFISCFCRFVVVGLYSNTSRFSLGRLRAACIS